MKEEKIINEKVDYSLIQIMSPWSLCLCQAWEVMSGDDKRRLADTKNLKSRILFLIVDPVHQPEELRDPLSKIKFPGH